MFPELTDKENEIIKKARELGFAVYYPAFPNAKMQAKNTLEGAKEFLKKYEQEYPG